MMGAGRLFGGIPWVQRHFEAVILVIILISVPVSYTHLRAHETVLDLVCRLLLEKKKDQVKHSTVIDV